MGWKLKKKKQALSLLVVQIYFPLENDFIFFPRLSHFFLSWYIDFKHTKHKYFSCTLPQEVVQVHLGTLLFYSEWVASLNV